MRGGLEMKKNILEKKVRQYNIYKTVKYFGYVVMGLSFLCLLGVAGNSDFYELQGMRGPSVSTLIIQTLICYLLMFIGRGISKVGEIKEEFYRREVAILIDILRKRKEKVV